MRTTCITISIATLLGLSACSDLHCLEHERKVGSICYPKTRAADASAMADDGDASTALDENAPDARARDAANTSNADATLDVGDGSSTTPTEVVVDKPDAALDVDADGSAAGSEANGGLLDASSSVSEANSGLVDASSSVSDASIGSSPTPPPCPHGEPNVCGGCDTLTHAKGEECSNGGTGPCGRKGTYQCMGTALACNAPPAAPSAEVCDGIDNDCDGTKDNGVANACGGCGAVPIEVCDALDNDCDGQTDEGLLNVCGACGAVPPEVCDGKDNDCDGQTDEADVTDAKTWYEDCDGDTFGKLENSVRACAKPTPPAGCMAYVDVEPVKGSTWDCRDDSTDYSPARSKGGPGLPGVLAGSPEGDKAFDHNCDGQIEVSGYFTAPGITWVPNPVCSTAGGCSPTGCVKHRLGTSLTTKSCGQLITGQVFIPSGTVCNETGTNLQVHCK